MIFKLLIILILSGLTLSCSEKSIGALHGTYISKEYDFVSKVLMQFEKKTYILHSKLVLNIDSSYNLTTCGNFIKGKWHVKQDSLFLICLENNFINDSINILRPPSCGTLPSVFFIKNSSPLELIDQYNYNKLTVLNNFIKIK